VERKIKKKKMYERAKREKCEKFINKEIEETKGYYLNYSI